MDFKQESDIQKAPSGWRVKNKLNKKSGGGEGGNKEKKEKEQLKKTKHTIDQMSQGKTK